MNIHVTHERFDDDNLHECPETQRKKIEAMRDDPDNFVWEVLDGMFETQKEAEQAIQNYATKLAHKLAKEYQKAGVHEGQLCLGGSLEHIRTPDGDFWVAKIAKPK